MKLAIFFLLLATATLVQGDNFQCDYGYTWRFAMRFYHSKVRYYNFYHDDDYRTIISVDGEHKSPDSFGEVKVVFFTTADCSNCDQLDFIPQGLNHIYETFHSLSFDGCPIETLSGHELDDYVNLIFFRLDNSKIVRIPDTIFAKTPLIIHVSFSYNQRLSRIPSSCLGNYLLLSFAFNNNMCMQSSPADLFSLKQRFDSDCPDVDPPGTCDGTTVCDLKDLIEHLSSVEIHNDIQIVVERCDNFDISISNILNSIQGVRDWFEEKYNSILEQISNLSSEQNSIRSDFHDLLNLLNEAKSNFEIEIQNIQQSITTIEVNIENHVTVLQQTINDIDVDIRAIIANIQLSIDTLVIELDTRITNVEVAINNFQVNIDNVYVTFNEFELYIKNEFNLFIESIQQTNVDVDVDVNILIQNLNVRIDNFELNFNSHCETYDLNFLALFEFKETCSANILNLQGEIDFFRSEFERINKYLEHVERKIRRFEKLEREDNHESRSRSRSKSESSSKKSSKSSKSKSSRSSKSESNSSSRSKSSKSKSS